MCVVYEDTLLAAMVNKKLKNDDLARKGSSVDFAACPID